MSRKEGPVAQLFKALALKNTDMEPNEKFFLCNEITLNGNEACTQALHLFEELFRPEDPLTYVWWSWSAFGFSRSDQDYARWATNCRVMALWICYFEAKERGL